MVWYLALWVGVCGSGWDVLRGFEGGVGGYAVFPVPTTEQGALQKKHDTAGEELLANAAACCACALAPHHQPTTHPKTSDPPGGMIAG